MTTTPVTPAPPAGPGSEALRTPASASLHRVLAVARRQWLVLKRSPHRFFDVLVWPLVDTLLYGSIGLFAAQAAEAAGGEPGTAATVTVYLLSGTVLWHLVHQTQISLATGFLEETWSRNILGLLATPTRAWEYLAGVGLFALVRTAAGTLAVAALAFGAYAFDVTTLGFGLIPVAALLLVCGWSVALLVVGLVLRFGSGAEALVWGALSVVMPLSGVFSPVSTLPAALRPIAQLLPTTHVFAVGRDLAAGHGISWGRLGLAAAGTAALAALSLYALLRMLRTFRRRGLVTRYS
ncbi:MULTISPECIES: ABC transporter permease [unclassified Streptomyces]|uniref:ABC transporter permease n=1 Tax=unclassified Streptomyces TaxID=2593676 RepID=UPI00136EFA31|nr:MULTISPECIES: ABC transporter permease [unclassified Streptomyces]MCW5252530.1 ABC transporter permease [Streptomyces sp. SHP 1-2]MYU26403.1 ABC transporter permease [Streptomyces sp. SID8352]